MNIIKMVGSYLKHNLGDKVKIGYSSEFLFCKEVKVVYALRLFNNATLSVMLPERPYAFYTGKQ